VRSNPRVTPFPPFERQGGTANQVASYIGMIPRLFPLWLSTAGGSERKLGDATNGEENVSWGHCRNFEASNDVRFLHMVAVAIPIGFECDGLI
jgi:hypothetical protein